LKNEEEKIFWKRNENGEKEAQFGREFDQGETWGLTIEEEGEKLKGKNPKWDEARMRNSVLLSVHIHLPIYTFCTLRNIHHI
jgi:hypothetical protein